MSVPDLTPKPLISVTGLKTVISGGDFSNDESLAEMSDIDIAKHVRRSMLADILKDGKIPQVGSDEYEAVMRLLADSEKQQFTRQKMALDEKRGVLEEEIKDFLVTNPGRLGSAQDIAAKIGGSPVDNHQVIIDHSKLEGFTFTEEELGSKPHNVDYQKAKEIVANYSKRIAEEAKSSLDEDNTR